jgi:PAS domain-containing protein
MRRFSGAGVAPDVIADGCGAEKGCQGMTWSWEIGLLVAISVLALVLALIAWRRRYIADLLEASLNATHQGRQVVDRAGAVKFANIAFRRLFGTSRCR